MNGRITVKDTGNSQYHHMGVVKLTNKASSSSWPEDKEEDKLEEDEDRVSIGEQTENELSLSRHDDSDLSEESEEPDAADEE